MRKKTVLCSDQPMLLLLLLLFPGNARCEVAVELAEPLHAALLGFVATGLENMEEVPFQSGGGGGGIVVINRSGKIREAKLVRARQSKQAAARRESTESLCSCMRRLLHVRRFRFLRDHVLAPARVSCIQSDGMCLDPAPPLRSRKTGPATVWIFSATQPTTPETWNLFTSRMGSSWTGTALSN